MKTFNIDYLRIHCVNEILKTFPNLNRTKILRKLSKALCYKSKGHINRAYGFDSNGFFIEKDDFNVDVPYDLVHLGFVFSEYILKDEFKVSLKEAQKIKKSIDKPLGFWKPLKEDNWFDGDIGYSDLERVQYGLKKIEIGESARLMASWPFEFYCRKEDNFSIQFNKQKLILLYDFKNKGFK